MKKLMVLGTRQRRARPDIKLRWRAWFMVFVCLLCLASPVFAQETLTITTYYPAPFGVYQEMRVHGRMAIGDANKDGTIDNNDLAHDTSGNPIPGVLTVGEGIGIGTVEPSTGDQALKLDVEGAVGATHYCDEEGNNCVQPPLGGGDFPDYDFNIGRQINGGPGGRVNSSVSGSGIVIGGVVAGYYMQSLSGINYAVTLTVDGVERVWPGNPSFSTADSGGNSFTVINLPMVKFDTSFSLKYTVRGRGAYSQIYYVLQ
jgi:hypothetical protein